MLATRDPRGGRERRECRGSNVARETTVVPLEGARRNRAPSCELL